MSLLIVVNSERVFVPSVIVCFSGRSCCDEAVEGADLYNAQGHRRRHFTGRRANTQRYGSGFSMSILFWVGLRDV